jgi:hypothetical protein
VIKSFDHFLRIMDERGHIPKENFDLCGVRTDKDINGNEVVR